MSESRTTCLTAPPAHLVWRPVIVDGLNYLNRGDNFKNYHGGTELINLIRTLTSLKCYDIRIVITMSVLVRILSCKSAEADLTRWVLSQGYFVIAPSRPLDSEKGALYDDLVVISTALKCKGLILSNDRFKDRKSYVTALSELWKFQDYLNQHLISVRRESDESLKISLAKCTRIEDLFVPEGGGG